MASKRKTNEAKYPETLWVVFYNLQGLSNVIEMFRHEDSSSYWDKSEDLGWDLKENGYFKDTRDYVGYAFTSKTQATTLHKTLKRHIRFIKEHL